MSDRREDIELDVDDDAADAAVLAVARERGIPPMVDLLSDEDLLAWWDWLSEKPGELATSAPWIERAFDRLKGKVENKGLLAEEKAAMLERVP